MIAADTPKRPRGGPRKTHVALRSCVEHLGDNERSVIEQAVRILEDRAVYRTENMSHSLIVEQYLKLKLAPLEHEAFLAIWLDAQLHLIAYEMLFTGTLTNTSVYPREVVKAALARNAAAVIFAHNHPSGIAEPSAADVKLTGHLKAALSMVDVELLDHYIVAGIAPPVSLAERGLV